MVCQARVQASRRGLDWFTFFVADIQTGFGPFLSVYLTTQKWTQVDIGLVLSIGSIASLLCQAPGGWLVDWARSKQRVAALAVIGIGISAFLIALAPVFSGDCRGQAAARRCELGSGPGHCRHYARPGGPCRLGGALGSQRPLCRRRQRPRRRGHGGLRLFSVGAGGFPRDRPAGDTGPAGAAADWPNPTWTRCGPTAASTPCDASSRPSSLGRLPSEPRAARPLGVRLALPPRERCHAAARRQRPDDAVEASGPPPSLQPASSPRSSSSPQSRRQSASSHKLGAGVRCS